jgi:hypothetical protein
VPKTGDDANMALWMMLFTLGLLGLTVTGTKLVMDKKGKTVKTSMLVFKDEDGKEQFIIK